MIGNEDKTITLREDQRSLALDLVIEAHAEATQEGADADIDLLGDILELLNSEGAVTFGKRWNGVILTFNLDQRVRLVEIFRNEKAEIEDGDVLYADPQLARETLAELVELVNSPADN